MKIQINGRIVKGQFYGDIEIKDEDIIRLLNKINNQREQDEKSDLSIKAPSYDTVSEGFNPDM